MVNNTPACTTAPDNDTVTVTVTEFPNGLRFSVFPTAGGQRLFTTKTNAAVNNWLRRNGYVAE